METRRCPLSPDYSFDLDALFSLVDAGTRLVFVTTPDNPSGYCLPLAAMCRLAEQLERHFPRCLLVVDEAYMDFAGASCGEAPRFSLLASGDLLANVPSSGLSPKGGGGGGGELRTGGLRLGIGGVPAELAGFTRGARFAPPFNLFARKGGLAVPGNFVCGASL